MSSPKRHHQNSVPRGSPADEPDPGTFQIPASELGLRERETCMSPLRAESLFPTAPAHKLCRPAGPAALGVPLSSTALPGWGVWGGAWTPHALERSFAAAITLPRVGLLRGAGLDCTMGPLFLPICVCFLLYIFSCGKSCFLFLGSFSSITGFK